jgi:hypothetical protein
MRTYSANYALLWVRFGFPSHDGNKLLLLGTRNPGEYWDCSIDEKMRNKGNMTILAATNGESELLLKRLLNLIVGMHSYIFC